MISNVVIVVLASILALVANLSWLCLLLRQLSPNRSILSCIACRIDLLAAVYTYSWRKELRQEEPEKGKGLR
jgi:hypothetical protein